MCVGGCGAVGWAVSAGGGEGEVAEGIVMPCSGKELGLPVACYGAGQRANAPPTPPQRTPQKTHPTPPHRQTPPAPTHPHNNRNSQAVHKHLTDWVRETLSHLVPTHPPTHIPPPHTHTTRTHSGRAQAFNRLGAGDAGPRGGRDGAAADTSPTAHFPLSPCRRCASI